MTSPLLNPPLQNVTDWEPKDKENLREVSLGNFCARIFLWERVTIAQIQSLVNRLIKMRKYVGNDFFLLFWGGKVKFIK